MRAWLLLTILLAGCAQAPTSSSPPVTGAPARDPYVESKGNWSIEVDEAIAGRVGSVVNFTLIVKGPAGPNGTVVFLGSEWAQLTGGFLAKGTMSRLPAMVAIGRDERLPIAIGEMGSTTLFEGPPLSILSQTREIPAVNATDVSDDPPGLSIHTTAGHVRVVFAPPHNATSTGDEADRAVSDFAYDAEARTLVGFVRKVSSDAIMEFPEPRRERVEVEADIAPGPLHVRVLTTVSCYCTPMGPEIVGRDVTVP